MGASFHWHAAQNGRFGIVAQPDYGPVRGDSHIESAHRHGNAHASYDKVMSPSLTHPTFFKARLISGQMTAGRRNEIRINPIQSPEVTAALEPRAISSIQPVYTPIWPTRPEVPIPEDTGAPFISR